MWCNRAHIISPLPELCLTKFKVKWTDVENSAFIAMKILVWCDVLISYPNFNERFIIHTDASKIQLWGVISQIGNTITFYSHRLTPAQRNYKTTERGLLSIVETFKEFRTNLLVHRITLYTHHNNSKYDNFIAETVLRWRLVLEEYIHEIKYIKVPDNDVEDVLIRLPLIHSGIK